MYSVHVYVHVQCTCSVHSLYMYMYLFFTSGAVNRMISADCWHITNKEF